MPILLGILSSVGVGFSDFLGRFSTRRASAITTVLTALMAGIATALALTLFVPGEPTVRDLALGGISGLGMGFALMLMYHGMAVSSTAVVSPLVATFIAIVPLIWDLSTGGSLSGIAFVGVLVALVGLAATTISGGPTGKLRQGLALATAAGLLAGVALIVVGGSSLESGAWPAVGQRTVAWLMLSLYATTISAQRLLPGRLLRIGLLSGIVGTGGMTLFILGAQRGSLSEVAVAASMFPAVTAVLAAVFDNDPLRWWQLIGIAGTLTGVGLIAAG